MRFRWSQLKVNRPFRPNGRRRVFRTLVAVSVSLAAVGPLASSDQAIAAPIPAVSFTFLQPGLTQELIGVSPNFFGGVAFAADGDPLVDNCAFSGSQLERFDLQNRSTVRGSSLAARSVIPSAAGCGLANHPNGQIYTNTSAGILALNSETGTKVAGPVGPAGNALGVATDPKTGNVLYVGSGGTILSVNPALTAVSTFSSATSGRFIDGIFFDPTGDYLFTADRTYSAVTILRRDGSILRSIPVGAEPDGIAFHEAAPKYVVTSNTNGTMTRFDFPNDDYSTVPTTALLASGGFRGDLTQVGPDTCLYVTQKGTRYNDGTVTGENSLVRICPGFAVVNDPPLAEPNWQDWTQGDVHVHASGDNELTNNGACTQEQIKKGETVTKYTQYKDVSIPYTTNAKQTEADCARLLVDRIVRRANKSDAKWLILTEHGAWLGLKWSWLWPHYDHAKGERQLAAVAAAASQATGVQLLTGEEMGTAAVASTWCGNASKASGHLGVYYTPRMVPNSWTDCDEIGYLKKLTAISGLGIGGPNHPDNGDGGSDWHCWTGDALLDLYPWDQGIGSCNGSLSYYGNDRSVNGGTAVVAPARSLEIFSDDHVPSAKAWSRTGTWIASGFGIAMVGGSDSHTTARGTGRPDQNKNNDGKVGLRGRTFARTGTLPANNSLTLSTNHPVRLAIEQGRTVASSGPLFVPRVGLAEPGDETTSTKSTINVDVFWPDGTAKILSDNINNLDSDAIPPTVSVSQRPETIEYRLYDVQTGCWPRGGTFDKTTVFCTDPVITTNPVVGTGRSQRATLTLPKGTASARYALVVHTTYAGSRFGDGPNKAVEAVASPIYISVGRPVTPTPAARLSAAAAAPEVAQLAADPSVVALVVDNAVVRAAGSGSSEFRAACVLNGATTLLGPISVPFNGVAGFGNVDRGSVCTVTQSASTFKTVSGRTITQVLAANDPNDTEVVFYFASAPSGIPADVVIESSALSGPVGTPISYNVSCNNGQNEVVTSSIGQISVLKGHFVGDICTVTYSGAGLSGLQPATQQRALFEVYDPTIEHSVLAPFSFTFSSSPVTQPNGSMPPGSQLKILNTTVAVPVGGNFNDPLKAGTANVHAVLSVNPQGKLNGTVQVSLTGGGTPLVTSNPTVEVISNRLLVTGTAKAGSVDGYRIIILTQPGTPGLLRLIVNAPDGSLLVDTAPTYEAGDQLAAIVSGSVTYG